MRLLLRFCGFMFAVGTIVFLVGVGAAAVDFQVGTGRMPMAQPGQQAKLSVWRKGQPVELTRSHYRGDAYDFVAEMALSGKG
mgnify:CR=1 FL=1